jgi:hypothetical protein
MNIGKACAIFEQIESEKYSDEEKAASVLMVLAMPTHNGVTKDAMLRVIRWLFPMAFDVEGVVTE